MDEQRKSDQDTREDLERPLGIAGEPIAHSPGDSIPESTDEAARRRRRARALGENEGTTGTGVDADHDGASGIDMGYGGEGTDVRGK